MNKRFGIDDWRCETCGLDRYKCQCSPVEILTLANSGVMWERTGELRIVRNVSHVGHPERLQQKWYCSENGNSEWQDVLVVDE